MQLISIFLQAIIFVISIAVTLYSCTDTGNKIRVVINMNEVETSQAEQEILAKYSREAGAVIPTGTYRSVMTGGNLYSKASVVSTVYIDAQKKQFKLQSQGTVNHLGIDFLSNNIKIDATARYSQTGKVLHFVTTGGDLAFIKPIIIDSVDPKGYTTVEFCDNSIHVNNITCDNGLAKIHYQKID